MAQQALKASQRRWLAEEASVCLNELFWEDDKLSAYVLHGKKTGTCNTTKKEEIWKQPRGELDLI